MSALGGEHMHEIRKLSEPLAAPPTKCRWGQGGDDSRPASTLRVGMMRNVRKLSKPLYERASAKHESSVQLRRRGGA